MSVTAVSRTGHHRGPGLGLLVGGLAVWAASYALLGRLSSWIAEDVLGLDPVGRLGSAVEFFLYEAPKVLLLLVLVVFGVGVLRSFVTPDRTRRWLAGRRETGGNVLAALLGVATPFCSCSAVPLFIGFVAAGVPLGVTLSFLIAAPMVNEVALVLLLGLFGWRVALLYAATGVAIAVAAGWAIGRLRVGHWVEPWVYDVRAGTADAASSRVDGWRARIAAGSDAVGDIVGKVWPYVIGGIAVGAAIHGYVPEGLLAGVMGADAWWSVPLAILLGVPMYSNAAGIIPIVQALVAKGAAFGTALAFMMAVIGLSLPELVILRKVLRLPLITTFVGIVAAGILFVGYLFNAVL